MNDFEKDELLWEPENGMENRQQPQTAEVPPEVPEEDITDVEFDIPEIPSILIAPEETITEEIPQVSAKQQLKDLKKQYRQEKKRMRGYGKGKLFLVGLLGFLLGVALGIATVFFLLK